MASGEFAEDIISKFASIIKDPDYNSSMGSALQGIVQNNPGVLRQLIAMDDGSMVPPLLAAETSAAAYALLSLGASPNAVYLPDGDERDKLPLIDGALSKLERHWLLPLLFLFGVYPSEFAEIERQMSGISPISLYLVMQRKIYILSDIMLSTSLSSEQDYPFWLEVMHRGLDLRDPHIAKAYKTKVMRESGRELFIILGLCYGLDIDTPVEDLRNNYIEEFAYVLEVNGTGRKSEYLSKLMKMTEKSWNKQSLLQAEYPVLAYLNQHDSMPYWEDRSFWIQKYKTDYGASLSGDQPRQEYLSRYEMVNFVDAKGQRGVIPNTSYGMGMGYTFRSIFQGQFAPVASIVNSFTAMGVPIPTDPYFSTLELMYWTNDPDGDNLYDTEQAMPTMKYSLTINGQRIQFENLEFLKGCIHACYLLGKDPMRTLGVLTQMIFE